jgi:alpha-mannosidase
MRNRRSLCFLSISTALFAAVPAPGYNPLKENIVYEIPNSHLDDQWQWTLDVSINQYIPATFNQNFALLQKYPEYKFSWEGAWRYGIVKTKYPTAWTTIKNYVAQGRWALAGGGADPGDVNIPSPEGMIRNYLYGQQFFMDEFGKKSLDIFLPDCFGFGYALPTIASHCGIKGFSSMKFDAWGGSFPTPFPIGKWIGVDGSSLYAYLKPGQYDNSLDIRTGDGDWMKSHAGFWATCDYIGTGDRGGAMDSTKAATMINRIRQNGSNTIKVYCVSSDQIFRDFDSLNLSGSLPVYDGELLMATHGTGCYTSWAKMKYKHRKNEERALAAEFSSVAANWLSGNTYAYPQDLINKGWWRLSELTFHDVLTGTSVKDAYRVWALPMEDSCYNEFTGAFTVSNTAAANLLNTTVSTSGAIPLVVVNPLGQARCDIVETPVSFGTASPVGITVYDPDGNEVPAQIKSVSGQTVTIVFPAKVPAASFSVFQVKPSAIVNKPDSTLTVNASTGVLENAFYKVTVNQNGDISSIVAKNIKNGQELFRAPSRFELRDNVGGSFPAWEVSWANVSSTPRSYVDQQVTRTVEESGPARVSLKVTRTKEGSTFTQYISLAADSAGARIDIDNNVNWLTKGTNGTLLKASFPFSCANPNATWDLGLGTIRRGKMASNLYEVCGQQWADLSATDNSYGIAVLNDCKYGWSKPDDNTLDLTLIHSPSGTGFGYDYECDQSNVAAVGNHLFRYSIYGHTGTWTNGAVSQGERMNQPLFAFQPSPHAGKFGKAVSLVRTSTPQVDIMAIKKAEKSGRYIVRVREASGASVNGAKLTFPLAAITAASEVNGIEEEKGPAQFAGNDLTVSLTKYQVKTFSVTMGTPVAAAPSSDELRRSFSTEKTVAVTFGDHRAAVRIPYQAIVRKVSLFNAGGRLVQNLTIHNSDGRSYRFSGSDTEKSPLPRGVYFIVVATDRGNYSVSTTLVK